MINFKNPEHIRILITIFGLLLSLYIAYLYSIPQPVTCISGEYNSCEVVRNSPYSTLLGVKVPLWGILYFMVLLGIQAVLLYTTAYTKKLELLLSVIIVFGVVFETYLTAIQLFILKGICTWCTLVEIVVVLLAIMHFLPKKDTIA